MRSRESTGFRCCHYLKICLFPLRIFEIDLPGLPANLLLFRKYHQVDAPFSSVQALNQREDLLICNISPDDPLCFRKINRPQGNCHIFRSLRITFLKIGIICDTGKEICHSFCSQWLTFAITRKNPPPGRSWLPSKPAPL